MLFLTLSGADVDFSSQKLRWKTYTTKKALPTTRRIELGGKKEFGATAFDPEHETYVIHVASFSSTLLNVHPSRRPQLSSLIAKEASTKIPNKYANFVDVFSPDLASKLPEYTGINNHAIKLVDGQ